MKLILADPNPLLCTAFHEHFKELSNVEIINDYFENLPEFDCMVSAANSFGLMTGDLQMQDKFRSAMGGDLGLGSSRR